MQLTLVAFAQSTLEAVGVEQVHIFALPAVRDEGHKAAVAPARQAQTGLLAHLAQQAVLRAFVFFEFPADADPFVTVFVVLPFHAVQQEIRIILLNIT